MKQTASRENGGNDASQPARPGRSLKQRVAVRVARILLLLAIVLGVGLGYVYMAMVWMPGKSHEGELPAITDAQRALAEELRGHVQVLAGDIGPRNVIDTKNYDLARAYLVRQLESYGYGVEQQIFETDGVECANIIAEVRGSSQQSEGGSQSRDGEGLAAEIIIVGAHYDSCGASPAANDNGTGVAATLALAKRFIDQSESVPRTVRFILFTNEEPPYFLTDDMGSLNYARRCKARGENIIAMISLETIGYYSDEPGSQMYPLTLLGWFYPTEGNFIGIVGNLPSRKLTRQIVGSFRRHAQFPSQGAALPGNIPGVGWSDHWAFWQMGYPAVMVTDTAPFRYPHYHLLTDTPDKIDYERTARVVEGMEAVVRDLARE